MRTDLTTVLQWIRNHDKKQLVFVANRVAETQILQQWINGITSMA